jgi:hypothetical protein
VLSLGGDFVGVYFTCVAQVRERMPVVAHRRTDLFTVAQK